MTKTEFKKLYHQCRLAEFNFNVRMENSNYPCGHDDYLYESFYNGRQDWLEQNPIIAQVIENKYETDILEWRYKDFLAWALHILIGLNNRLKGECNKKSLTRNQYHGTMN